MLDINKWRCCEKFLHSQFCPSCGAERPSASDLRNGEVLADWLEHEERKAASHVATLEAKLARGFDGPKSWDGENLYRQQSCEASIKSFRKRRDTFSRRAKVVRGLIQQIKELKRA